MPSTKATFLMKLHEVDPNIHKTMQVLPTTMGNWIRSGECPTYVEAFAKCLYAKGERYTLLVPHHQRNVVESFLDALDIPWEQDK